MGIACSYSLAPGKSIARYCWTKLSSNRGWLFLFFNNPEIGNYSPSFNLTYSDLKNPFPHKHPPFSAFLRKTFRLLHRSSTRFAIRTSRHMAFTHNMVMIIIHTFSIKRSQFLFIFCFHYAIMLMTYK